MSLKPSGKRVREQLFYWVACMFDEYQNKHAQRIESAKWNGPIVEPWGTPQTLHEVLKSLSNN